MLRTLVEAGAAIWRQPASHSDVAHLLQRRRSAHDSLHDIEVKGRLRLGSFHKILTFAGRGIEEEPEFDVPLDQRMAHDYRKPGAHPGDHRGAPVALGAELSVA